VKTYLLREMNIVGKKVIIVISLVEESGEMSDEEIKRDLVEELSEILPRIPWMKEVESVTVTEV